MRSGASIVQFSAFMFYADEGDSCQIDIMRLGAIDTCCSVEFETQPSKLEGIAFEAAHGTVSFEAGESMKSVQVNIIDNTSKGSTFEVMLRLHSPIDCTLGLYLRQTRIKVVDDDFFPTTKFAADLANLKDPCLRHDKQWTKGKNSRMLVEFFKFSFACTRSGSIKMLVAGQVENLIWVSRLMIMKSVVNEIASGDGSSPTDVMLCVYALALLIPYSVNHYLQYRRQFWGVGGGLRAALLQNLLDNFLYYEESSRGTLNVFEWCGLAVHEVTMLINNAYMEVFAVFTACGKILCALGFIVYTAASTRNEVFLVLAPWPFLFPIVYFYIHSREANTELARKAMDKAKVSLDTYVGQTVEHYRTVADYWARPLVMSQAEEKIGVYNERLVHAGARRANDEAFFGWVIQAMECLQVVAGGVLARSAIIQVGTFSALLSAAVTAAGQFQSVLKAIMEMQACYVSMWKAVDFINVPTDLRQRKIGSQARRAMFAEMVRQTASAGPSVIIEDTVPICVESLTFTYSGYKRNVLSEANLVIDQGSFVAVVGDNSSGKDTLLQIIASVLLPTTGKLFVPPHLRVLHLRFKEKLWQRPLSETLFFGIMVGNKVSRAQDLNSRDKERGLRICRRLGLDGSIIKDIEDEMKSIRLSTSSLSLAAEAEEESRVALELSGTSRFKLQLAAAFVTDPEVLLIHRPIAHASVPDSERIMKLLREFVNQTGIENDPETRAFRRPRTCIISMEKPFHLDMVDKAVTVKDGSIVELDDGEKHEEHRSMWKKHLEETAETLAI